MTRTPDSDHIWVFDLDNTLYPAECDLFGLMDERMGAYVSDLLGVGLADARAIQKHYFYEHGTTLAGLMVHHDVDPHHYLDFVHDIDLDRLSPDPGLARLIKALPGRKLVLTNADTPYALKVLERRGLADCFEAIFDIHDARYRPKPDPEPYRAFCARHGVDSARATMFEDMARNLRPAKELGMATVWINNGSEQAGADACPSFIDHETRQLDDWLAQRMETKTL